MSYQQIHQEFLNLIFNSEKEAAKCMLDQEKISSSYHSNQSGDLQDVSTEHKQLTCRTSYQSSITGKIFKISVELVWRLYFAVFAKSSMLKRKSTILILVEI